MFFVFRSDATTDRIRTSTAGILMELIFSTVSAVHFTL